MKIPFTKLHGAKNDFLLTLANETASDAPTADLHEIAIAICNRYTGIGADGWMLLDPTPGPDFDASIRLFNSDGSEPELSGNGTRCAAALLALQNPAKTDFRIWTAAGVKSLHLISHNHLEYLFEMNMGDKVHVVEQNAKVQGRPAVIVDCGNPQCVFPVENFDFDWRIVGASTENDPRFPNRTNVSFVKPRDENSIEVRFWERGAGETNSSGTGSTGAALAAIALGIVRSPVTVYTPAGTLAIRVLNGTWLTGPAEYVADGFFHHGTI
jgi:diaminopimelate epimerase